MGQKPGHRLFGVYLGSIEQGNLGVVALNQEPAEAVYVLHCFQKKTQKTSKADLDLAEARYRVLLSEVKQ
uniref:type II toxin-antitoxin system RelE/ParE family toxin n=1 Tax=uncultured Halomonas sp. TaxID=173971 RepID=UPI00263130D5|nr:type II toxin-antitoxin system RelE/ParE family toxin [uncultured Halomonas sp.]